LWIFVFVQYAALPATIPIHFNLKAEIDNYGSKATLFILPVIITIVVAGLTILGRYPHIFNYPKKITAANALEEYSKATGLLRIIKLVIAVFSLIILFFIVQSAKAGHSTLPWWIIPLFMMAMIIPVVITIISSFSNKKQLNR